MGQTTGTPAVRQWQTYKKSETGKVNVIIERYLDTKDHPEREREGKREKIYLVIIQEDTGLFYIKTNSLLYRQ